MNKNVLIKKNKKMRNRPLKNCHNGKGTIQWKEIITQKETPTKKIRLIHEDIIPPNTSIGIHKHEKDEEYYYILSGKGVMTLDNKEYIIEKGDLTGVYPGSSHGLENPYNNNIRLLVISINHL